MNNIPSFTELPHPLVVGSIRQRSPLEAIADIKASETDGAKAFIYHIQLMDEQYHNFTFFQKIANSTVCPIMALNYRKNDREISRKIDEQLIEVQFEAVRAGYRSVDLPAATFDENQQESIKACNSSFAKTNPKDISMRPEIIELQREVIRKFHAKGTEVLVSSHVLVELTCEETVDLALEIQSRGADIVKIVCDCKSQEQQVHILETNLELQKRLDVPFLYMCIGPYSKFTRHAIPFFGSMLVFGHHEYNELSNRMKPLLSEIREFNNTIPLVL